MVPALGMPNHRQGMRPPAPLGGWAEGLCSQELLVGLTVCPLATEAGKLVGRKSIKQIPREEQTRKAENSHGVRASGFSLLLRPGCGHALRSPAPCQGTWQQTATVATRRAILSLHPQRRTITSAGGEETRILLYAASTWGSCFGKQSSSSSNI